MNASVEDWMMTETDVNRLWERLRPAFEKRGLVNGVRLEIAQRESWEAYLYVPSDLCVWRTLKYRLQRICAETGLNPQKLLDSRNETPACEDGDRQHCVRFTIRNPLMTADVARNYVGYCDRMRKARRGRLVPDPLGFCEEPWRRINFRDDDGAVYEDGVILPKQDPNASDMAIIALHPEHLDYHQDEGGFGEGRHYTPYYAKKFLTRPIRRVKINYGHQGPDESKNLWVIYELDKLTVRIGGEGISPYRRDGTLKTRADYGTDEPILGFGLCGHKILAGSLEKHPLDCPR